MCGIHGFAWKDDAAGRRMVDAARHRGPDGDGVWSDHRVTLGHNLLAITEDADKALQPWSHAGRYELVFNGEVYNYRDLRHLFPDHIWRTDSDTEVLAVGLAMEGYEFLRRVDGMYALGWYDRELATLTLARDTNGARPLYAGWMNGRPAFSSEIRSLLALGFPRVVSRDGFRHYYHAGLCTGPLTLFQGIYRLVPGEVITFDLNWNSSSHTNLQPTPGVYAGPEDAVPDILRAKLRQAVHLAMSRRMQVGLFLSGGMDSAAIYYELVAGLKIPTRTFTTRFVLPNARCRHNEDADHAADLVKPYKSKHREVLVGEREWTDNFEKAVLAMEEPRQGKSHPAYYATNRLLKQSGCTVTLAGDGGDELLMGYKHQHNPPFARRLEALRPRRELPDPGLALSLDEQTDYLDDWLPTAGLTGDPLNDFLYAECLTTLAEDFLVRNDKLGAAFSMEARFPMMCNVFRDFCRSLPGVMKAGTYLTKKAWDVNTKALLRQAYTDRLPLSITCKGKTGWRAPTDEWLVGTGTHPAVDGPARQYVRSVLVDPQIRELFGITEGDIEHRYLNNTVFAGPPKASGKPSVGPGMASQKELFSVLMFAVWFKSFDMRLW